MKVSIIIPVYNAQDYIIDCLKSVMDQSYVNIECLIIDDGSKENYGIELIKNILAEYRGEIDFKLIILEENKGASGARNEGISLASGDYLYFLDSDDEITSNCISLLVADLENHPNADLVQGNVLCENEVLMPDISLNGKGFPDFSTDKSWIRNHLFLSLPIVPWNKLIKVELLRKESLYFHEGIVNEDVLWLFRLRKSVKSIVFNHEVTYLHKTNLNSVMNSPKNELKRINSYLKILKVFISEIDDENKLADNFAVLKHFMHNKLLVFFPENQNYFKTNFDECLSQALNSEKVPWYFKLMYFTMKLPGKTYKNFLWFWKKNLGLLYRISIK